MTFPSAGEMSVSALDVPDLGSTPQHRWQGGHTSWLSAHTLDADTLSLNSGSTTC